MKSKKINIPLIDVDVNLHIDKTTEAINTLLRDSTYIEHEDSYAGFCILVKGEVHVWINSEHNEIRFIAHELYHAVNKACLAIGYKPTTKNHEPGAYIMEHLMPRALKFYKPKT